jgi:glycosyltransferase involved in cell wall biosynthesis
MRIAYLAALDVSRPSGVLKKILSQITVWSREGNQVALFVVSPQAQVWSGAIHRANTIQVLSFDSALGRFKSWMQVVRRIQLWAPDVLYWRAGVYQPWLERLTRLFPTVYEFNTYDVREYRQVFSTVKYAYHMATRKRLLSLARGYVVPTSEIGRMYNDRSCPVAVIPNGIMLEEFKQLTAPRTNSPRLCFIGSPGSPWHGVDKLVVIAKSFPDWEFDVVGYRREDLGSDVPPNLCCHGYMSQAQYEGLFAECHVAIGSLALYRNGLEEACPLKVREYLAYGLPVINAYKDSDFPGGAPFLLELPNKKECAPGDLEKISRFVNSWIGRRVQAAEVRCIDMAEKERARLSFMFHCARTTVNNGT